MLLALASLLLFSLPGASSDRPHNAAVHTALGACALAGKGDIERALGQALSDGKEDFTGPGSTCSYEGGYGEVTISLQRLESKPDIAAELRAMQSAVSGSRVREAADLGPSAFLLDLGESGAQIHLIRNEREYLMVSVLGFGDAARAGTIAKEIAREIVLRAR